MDTPRPQGSATAGTRPRTIGIVTAFPPGKNSLNEFGWHFVTNLAPKREVAEVVLYADQTPDGAPTPVDSVRNEVCWTFNSWKNAWAIRQAIKRSKPDAVLFNLQFATFGDRRIPGGLGLLTPALVKMMGIPTAVVLHNLVENVDMRDAGFASNKLIARAMSFAGTVLTKLILRADYVALTIPRYVEMLRDKYHADNVLLAPHGAFEVLEQPDFGVPEGPRQLLAFGKWGTYKTVDMLIDAYRILLARGGYDDVEVVIAGTDSPNSKGYLAATADTCRDLPGVRFTGYVDEADVPTLFGSAAVTVFPYTSTTGSSGVLHQAGSYGRAAVLPRIGDFAEVIEEEGFIGEYFDPADATSLADAIANVIDDPARRQAMGRRNFAAAAGIPISEVIDWHLIHLEPLIAAARS
jgi:glycosyltransferase involved in cell wall biosynthesis